MKKLIIITWIITSIVLATYANDIHTNKIEFQNIGVPSNDLEKRKVIVSSFLNVNGKKKTNISYNTILRSGDLVKGNIFGLIYDINSKPINAKDGSPRIANSNDFSSIIPVGKKLFMISHFESRPAAMYITQLKQNKINGKLKAISTKNIDFSSVNGVWTLCAGSVTPWGTHLGAEEYEPDARKIKADGSIDPYYNSMGAYFDGNLKVMNPYDYGWIPEIKILNEKGDVKPIKHYSMGRFSHELGYVMPDKKTVYLSDDGVNEGFFMFIADKKEDLSAGTLYAAKWQQTGILHGGKAKIKWISLGHAKDKEIKAALDNKLKFKDLFNVSNFKKEGFTSINTYTGHEYLKLNSNVNKIVVSRLETRRYAAMKGATTEFRKMEGITYNKNKNVLYFSLSEIGKGMEDKVLGKKVNKYDVGGNNDIHVKHNKCGGVYQLNISSDEKDLENQHINSKYVVNFIHGLVIGIPKKTDVNNECSVNGIANPDNITYLSNANTLMIGEDTHAGHQNDYIWAYNLDSKKLTRVETTPYGSETTSLYYYNNIGGHGYLMSVIQHPYGEPDATTSTKNMKLKAKSLGEMRAYTGYIGPLPVVTK